MLVLFCVGIGYLHANDIHGKVYQYMIQHRYTTYVHGTYKKMVITKIKHRVVDRTYYITLCIMYVFVR